MVMLHVILCDVNHFLDDELHSIIDQTCERKYKFGYTCIAGNLPDCNRLSFS